MYSETVQRRVERQRCKQCGQPLPPEEKYGIQIGPTSIVYRGKRIRLSTYHLLMFEALLRAAPEIVTKERLFVTLYADAEDGGPHSRPLDALMWQMRKKLRGSGLHIETVYALGWRLVPPLGALE